MKLKGTYWAVDYADDCEQCYENWTVHPQAVPCNECLEDIRMQEEEEANFKANLIDIDRAMAH